LLSSLELKLADSCHFTFTFSDLRRDSKKDCTSAPFFEVPIAIRRQGRSDWSCWMMTPWCLIASLGMAFGIEPNAYEKHCPWFKLLPLST